ncbi:MAG: hypothetical protein KGJ06_03580 [Pseudomonadota bacterium]|nr:hypothetical protein [Pseudomonadota bacterium]
MKHKELINNAEKVLGNEAATILQVKEILREVLSAYKERTAGDNITPPAVRDALINSMVRERGERRYAARLNEEQEKERQEGYAPGQGPSFD